MTKRADTITTFKVKVSATCGHLTFRSFTTRILNYGKSLVLTLNIDPRYDKLSLSVYSQVRPMEIGPVIVRRGIIIMSKFTY